MTGTARIEERMGRDGTYKKIKENVWKLEKEYENFSIKQYHSISTVNKVKKIHEGLRSIEFPHTVSVIPTEEPLLFIQPWLDGARAVNFKKRADRTDSLAALCELHATKRYFDWNASTFLHPYPLISKWEDRVERFQEIGKACETYIDKKQVDEIIYYAEKALAIVKRNKQSDMDVTLLHGDVVHHNILRDIDGRIRFIDFDLACTGPAGIELALWIHRVLPQIDYDINFLFNEQPVLKKLDDTSLSMLLFPNELLREWLHFFTLPKEARERQIKQMIPFTLEALSHWPKLWYDIERING